MGRLGGFRYREIISRLKRFGFIFHRQAAGSHEIWYCEQTKRYTTIPTTPVTCRKERCAPYSSKRKLMWRSSSKHVEARHPQQHRPHHLRPLPPHGKLPEHNGRLSRQAMNTMHSTYCSFIALLLLGTSACTTPAPKGPVSNGDVVISVFDTCHVRFDTAWKKGEAPDTYGLLRLDAGRVVMTKITVPHFDKRVDVHLRMRLVSLGDPWDKAGSLFILPGADLPLFQQVENGTLPMDTTGYPGVVAQAGYAPAIELLRFMTPFGIGHFSDTARVRPPIYVPQWEKSVTWDADITPLLSALEGEVWLGCYIDTWTKEGFSITVELTFDESDIAGDLVKKQQVLPLCNTVRYVHPQRAYAAFHDGPLDVPFNLPDSAKDVQLHYITTGHGGHEGGDEFVRKENRISLDDSLVKAFTPWRDDCASFRRFNPTSGVWRVKTKDYHGKPEEQSLASSDLSRSGWCPGSMADPVVMELHDLGPGEHVLSIAIPEAQQWDGKANELNHWLVSAYLTWRE